METIILTAHVVIAIIIVALILIQHGKGADAGATFGAGNAGTVFGAAGTGNFLSRTTAILTAIFFATSLTLAIFAKNKASDLYKLDAPVATKKAEVNDAIKSEANKSNTEKTADAFPAASEKPAPKLVTPQKLTDKPVETE